MTKKNDKKMTPQNRNDKKMQKPNDKKMTKINNQQPSEFAGKIFKIYTTRNQWGWVYRSYVMFPAPPCGWVGGGCSSS
jgi:hypothetical protein